MIDWQRALRIMLHIALGLDFAYENKIVHRNITPHNILIEKEGDVAKLGDLILAKAQEGSLAATITRPGELLGDLVYMSPEQTRGEQDLDTRSDMYNLAATIYRLVAGRPPLKGANPAQTIRMIQQDRPEPPTKFQLAIPAGFEGIIMKSLSKDPDERFATPAALLRDLQRLVDFHNLGE